MLITHLSGSLLHADSQDNANAQFRLGWLIEDGRGVPRDLKEASKWNALAAEQGHAKAQFRLGQNYETQMVVPKHLRKRFDLTSHLKAFKWYQVAAEQGEAGAETNMNRMALTLGLMYLNGWGVQQDDSQAIKWYRIAAKQFSAARKALTKLGDQ